MLEFAQFMTIMPHTLPIHLREGEVMDLIETA